MSSANVWEWTKTDKQVSAISSDVWSGDVDLQKMCPELSSSHNCKKGSATGRYRECRGDSKSHLSHLIRPCPASPEAPDSDQKPKSWWDPTSWHPLCLAHLLPLAKLCCWLEHSSRQPLDWCPSSCYSYLTYLKAYPTCLIKRHPPSLLIVSPAPHLAPFSLFSTALVICCHTR